MKKILILGANGFIGKSLSQLLNEDKYDITTLNRQELDATDFGQLKLTLEMGEFDFVINAALSGQGRLLKQDTAQNFYENLKIQENLVSLQHLYSKLIIFGSGSEGGRSNDINNLKEGEYGNPPADYYELAKYINSKNATQYDKIINIRIFNVFGSLEKEDRFIKTCIKRIIDFSPINIYDDVYFDFFYINDLKTLIEYYIDNPPDKFEEINAVYNEKKKLSEIVSILSSISGLGITTSIIQKKISNNYFGSGYKLAELRLPLTGLYLGLDEVYGDLKYGK